ncbi:hypothetical protein RvY_11115 [Ramazzottius varieornatus]|uniref:Uncharacterized protein n=1 Tax=Ramazzottius varieornatus TaxID=947166 RepID=A0A1D1VJG2_RAMVA|nr:hypothetical protein RvY_11115 [Ramazzottius varieornatus]
MVGRKELCVQGRRDMQNGFILAERSCYVGAVWSEWHGSIELTESEPIRVNQELARINVAIKCGNDPLPLYQLASGSDHWKGRAKEANHCRASTLIRVAAGVVTVRFRRENGCSTRTSDNCWPVPNDWSPAFGAV